MKKGLGKRLLALGLSAVMLLGTVPFVGAEEKAAADDTVVFNGHKYQVFDESVTWYEAKEKCEALGGHLVTITSKEENAAISKLISDYNKSFYWIGATDEKVEGEWEWVNGEKFQYNNGSNYWADGQAQREDHAAILRVNRYGNSGQWNDFTGNCTYDNVSLFGFICEWGDEDNAQDDGRIEFNGHYYQVFDKGLDWNEAKKYCESLGGHLVTITSQEEQELIESMLRDASKNSYWLGAELVGDEFVWVTEEAFSYTHWQPGQPDNLKDEHALMIYRNINPVNVNKFGQWNNLRHNGTFPNESFFGLDDFGFICEWDGSDYSDIDRELIEKVSLYTSDGGETYKRVLEKLLDKLKDDSISQDLRSQLLNEFYTLSGITDIDEAIAWCNDASNAKRAYDFLTDDEVYLAYQYGNYLNNTVQGNIARGLLLSSGWIFNGDLLQYVDPITFVTKETHSIKNYKTMLLDFMEYDSMATELATSKKVMTATLKDLGESVDIAGQIRDEWYDQKFTQLSKSATIEDAQKLFKECYGEITKVASGDESIVFKTDLDLIETELKDSKKGVNLVITAAEDIISLIQLESRMETIQRYSEFLTEITEGTEFLPYGLIVAAQQLLDELENGLTTLLKNVAVQLADSVGEIDDTYDVNKFLYSKVDDVLASKFPSWGLNGATVASAIGVIELGAWCVDQITGIGELVKQSAYVEAYAMLGMYYSTLLAQCKTAFLADKSVENAWDFYDHYQLLFAIRSKGENTYLAMCRTQGIINILLDLGWNAFGIQDREAYVQKTFEYMNEHCVFALENADAIENGHRYPQKAVIQCPVNIEVYDQTGNLIYTLYDGKPVDETNDIGRFVCMYRPSTGEYVKAIYLNDTNSYQLRIVGTDTGNVDISTAVELDGKIKTSQKVEIPITKDGTIILNTVSNDYSVDSDGDGVVDDSGSLTENESDTYVAVTGISLECTERQMKVGEKCTLGARILPDNATFSTIQWTSSDSSVASVNGNGAVTAISAGTATITATTADGGYTATCTVTVRPLPADYTSLDELIDRTDAMFASDEIDNYTKDSVAVLESALEQAKAVDRNLTSEQQTVIDAAAHQLQTALDGLVRYTKLDSVTIVPTNPADEKSGELIYHKTPWYKTWTSQTVGLGVHVNEGAEIKSIRWQAANWSVDDPEAVFEGATDRETVTVRPTFGVGPRSFWVQAVVEDYNGNIIVSAPVKVRFYNWDWQK